MCAIHFWKFVHWYIAIDWKWNLQSRVIICLSRVDKLLQSYQTVLTSNIRWWLAPGYIFTTFSVDFASWIRRWDPEGWHSESFSPCIIMKGRLRELIFWCMDSRHLKWDVLQYTANCKGIYIYEYNGYTWVQSNEIVMHLKPILIDIIM